MKRFTAKVEQSGRILIPAPVRRRLGLKEGQSKVVVTVSSASLVLTTRAQAVREAQDLLRPYAKGRLLSQELIQDRIAEAKRDRLS